MQVLSSPTAYNGVIQGTYKMASGEGLLSLWRGMSSVVAGAGETSVHQVVTHASSLTLPGPAHAVYFATYEAVKHVMGGNQAGVHHPLAAGMCWISGPSTLCMLSNDRDSAATSGACATIASDALMNPFDGMVPL